MRRRLLHLFAVVAMLATAIVGLTASPRPVFAVGQPVATLNVPSEVLIGQPFTFTVTFDNTHPSDTGYGPFVDLVFPATGVDGNDGITFLDATYLGAALNTTSITFDADGCVPHPYARLTDGTYQQVCGRTGDTLVVIQLPFGSFTPEQPPVEIRVQAAVSPLADLGVPLPIYVRAGFQFGNDPLDNWCCDPVILNPVNGNTSTWPNQQTTPTLFSVRKTYLGPEDETATGPNFPRQYRIDVDIANGQTVTNLEISDTLSPQMQFVSLDAVLANGSPVSSVAVSTPSTTTPGGTLTRRIASVTGTTSSADASMIFTFYVPRLGAGGVAVLNPATGAPRVLDNNAGAGASWTPNDNRDPSTLVSASAGTPGHRLTARSIATQKRVAVVNDVGAVGYTPGDTLEYTIDVQISDFFAFNQVTLVDVLSDGQRFDTSFPPTLEVVGNGFVSATAPFVAANYTVTPNYTPDSSPPNDGTTSIEFRISNELATRGQNGNLIGGCVPPGGTGGPAPDCNTYNDGPTTARVVFRAIIQENYSDSFPSGDPSVDEGDVVSNQVTVAGTLLNVANLTSTGVNVEDGSGARASVGRGALSKSIYAINGSTALPNPVQLAPGDTVTYRIQLTLPTSDVENLRLVDYLPLPIFPVTAFNFDPSIAGSIPPVNTATYGPDDTWRGRFDPSVVPDPVVSVSAVGNSVSFNFGTFDDPDSRPSQIDLLLTVRASDRPTADRLLLTNQVRRIASSTGLAEATDDAIVQVLMTQPILRISKGVTGSTNPNATLTPPTVGPVSFAAPGSAGPPFTGTIGSTALAATPVDSNITGVDANDLVSFAIVIENTGSSSRGAFDIAITDVLPPGLIIPTTGQGLNLKVYNGAGTAIPFTYLGGGGPGNEDDLFNNGIQLIDTSVGACQGYHPNDGSNIIVITYDLQVDPNVQPGQVILNRGTLTQYAGIDGGMNHVDPAGPPFDRATVTAATPQLTKSIVATSEAHTEEGLSPTPVAIGEIVRYRLAVRVPEGRWDTAQIQDRLPDGLRFLNDGTASVALISNGAGLTSDTLSGSGLAISGNQPTAPSFLLPDAAVSASATGNNDDYGSGTDVFFNLGTLTNADNDSDDEYVVVEFNALVENVSGNTAGVQRANDFIVYRASNPLIAPGGSQPIASNSVAVRVVEPARTLEKLIVAPASATGDAGDTITYRIDYANPPGANVTDAFDLTIRDELPSNLTLNVASVTVTLNGGAVNYTNNSAGNRVDVTIEQAPPGSSVRIEYTATVGTGVTPGQALVNTANLTYTSLPGPNGTTTNPTGSATPGASGSGTGERIATASDPATLTVIAPAPTKSVVATSEAHTSDTTSPPQAAIGEIVRYRLAVRLAEGSAPNFQLLDELPDGLTFLNDGSARVAFVANGGGISSSTITTALPGCSGLNVTGNSATLAALPSSSITCPLPAGAISPSSFGTGADPTFSLGNLTNSDSDADDEFVVVEFNALVDNTSTGNNVAGANRTNRFTVRVNDTSVGVSPGVNVQVVEPSLTLNKQVLVSPADAGDTVTYRVTYTNATGANRTTAFDVRLVDTLPAYLTLDTNSVNVSLSGGASGVTNNSVGNTVEIVLAQIPPGGSVTVQYSARVNADAPNGRTLTNNAVLTYTSLPGPNGTTTNPTGSATPGTSGSDTGERDGSNTGRNNYRRIAGASVTLATPTIEKLPPAPAQYTIGETVTFDLRVTLPEGVTRGLTVTDDLPPGLALTGYSIITDDPNLTAPYVGNVGSLSVTRTSPANVPGASGEDLTLTFPDVTTTDDNNPTNNAFLVRLQARVLNVIGNQNGASLTNTARLSFTNPNTNTSVTVNAPTARTITVVEPVLSIAKSISNPPNPADAGGVVTYRVVIGHAAGSVGTAYDVVVTDPIPAGLINAEVVNVSAVGIAPPSAAISGGVVRVPASGSFDLPPGASVTLEFRAEIGGSVSPGQTITNGAVAVWSSLDGDSPDERTAGDGLLNSGALNDYEIASSVSFTTDQPELTKALVATSASHTGGANVTIGEIVTYELVVALPEGVIPSLSLTDDLPVGLAFVPGSVTVDTTGFNGTVPAPTVSGGAGSGDDVTISFNTINVAVDNDASNNSFRVRLQARVLNVTGNVGLPLAQTTLTNRASVTVGANSPITSNQVTVTVVEPRLEITTSFNPNRAYAGQTVEVTLTVRNTGTSDAFDVVIEDLLDARFVSVAESGTPSDFSFSYDAATRTVRYSGGSIPTGESRTFTFHVTLANPVTVGQTIPNSATSSASSLPGSSTDERSLTSTSNTATLTTIGVDLVVSKSDGGSTATPGARITYTLTFTNTGNQDATGVVLTETVPLHTTFDAAGSTAGWSCTPDGSAGSTCTLTIGSLAAGASESATFAVRVQGTMPAGVTQIANTARIGDDGANGADLNASDNTASDSTPLSGFAPELELTKEDNGASATPGGVITYTLRYRNNGTIGATGVVLTETVPLHTTFEATGSTAGWSCTPDGSAGSTCTLTIGSLAAGASGSATFAVRVNGTVPAGVTQIANAARIGDDGANGADGNGANNTASDSTPLNAAPDLRVTKEDGVAFVLPGQEVTYVLRVRNAGTRGATGVTVRDELPGGVSFVGASDGGAVNGGEVRWPPFDLPAGAEVTRTVTVRVANPFNDASGVILNRAAVSDDGTNGSDPTPDNNTASDTNYVRPDLALTKSDGGASAEPGGVIRFTLHYTNVGGIDVRGVTLRERVPPYTRFDASLAENAGWSCTADGEAGSECVYSVGALAAGQSGTVSFAVRVRNPLPAGVTAVVNAARIGDDGGRGPDRNASDNEAQDSTPLNAAPDLRVTKEDGGASATPGGVITYTLTFTNTGDQDATGVVLTETVPLHTTFEAAGSTAGWSCADGAPAGTSCTFNVGSLAAGASGSVTFAVRVNSTVPAGVTQIANTARIGDDGANGADRNASDNEAQDSTPLNAAPDLVVIKSNGGGATRPGATLVYQLAYQNVGNRGATGVVITETVPEHTVFNAAQSTRGWLCPDGAPEGTVCAFPVGRLAAGAMGSVDFAVVVKDPLPADVAAIVNTASISDDGANGVDPTPNNNRSTVRSFFTPTAVTLLHLAAARGNEGVVLNWTTGVEIDVAGFLVYRSATDRWEDAVLLTATPIVSRGSSVGGASYAFTDTSAEPGQPVWYWLVAVETDGDTETFGPIRPRGDLTGTYQVYLPFLRR